METLCVSLTERSLRLAVNQRITSIPLDINMNYGDGDAPLKDKANFIMSMLELVVGGSGLTAEEKSVIDRCLPKIYEKYFNEPEPKKHAYLTRPIRYVKKSRRKGWKKTGNGDGDLCNRLS